MAYKNIDALLNEMGHLSKPGLRAALELFFDELEFEVKGYIHKFPDRSLIYTVIGYQHGYTARSVAEYLIDSKASSLLNYAVENRLDSASYSGIAKTVYADMNKFIPVMKTDTNPFFYECEYFPSSDELGMDPLDVIMDINTRRTERQKTINVGGGNVQYPSFGTWVDKAIRIGSAAEAKAIKSFRSEIQKEIQLIERAWFI